MVNPKNQQNYEWGEEDTKNHSGIAAIIQDSEDRILVFKHSKHNKLTIPIGKVKPTQTVKDALLVELKEELDIVPTHYKLVRRFNKTYQSKGFKVETKNFIYHIFRYRGTPKNIESHIHLWMRYMSLDELDKIRTELSDATIEAIDYLRKQEHPLKKLGPLLKIRNII